MSARVPEMYGLFTVEQHHSLPLVISKLLEYSEKSYLVIDIGAENK